MSFMPTRRGSRSYATESVNSTPSKIYPTRSLSEFAWRLLSVSKFLRSSTGAKNRVLNSTKRSATNTNHTTPTTPKTKERRLKSRISLLKKPELRP